MRNHVTVLCWTATLALFTTVDGQSLPYNPSTILQPRFPTTPGNIAYAFLPSGPNQQLVSLNISANLSASKLGLNTITSNLPFSSNDGSALTPVVAANGEISVYTGSCNVSTSAALWRFTPSNTSMSTIGNGIWAQENTNTGSSITAASLPGAHFLSRGLTFSTIVHANASQTKIYLFGGMCPTSNATEADWQSEALYSSSMLRLAPTTSTAKTSYTLDTTYSRGPPVSEAGFTITGLGPSYSNATGVQTQQQSFVLVGGHTKTAFINMSQVAVWSLPEESWSFVSVDSPSSSSTNTELAIKSTVTSVDSRSGHSAVLSEDGTSIIVYGGWVGDVSTAADPQLAILELGTGYGGTGDWKWVVPASQPGGSGMFGHGALMLPGNVMMVLGGYNISASGNAKRAVSAGTQALFFNATSMSWVTEYTNPNYVAYLAAQAAQAAARSARNSRATKLGLGLGIGLGLLAVILAIIFCCIYSRRIRKRNEMNREKIVGDLAGGSFYSTPNRNMSQTSSSVFPWANRGWNGGQDPNSAVDGYVNLQHDADHGLESVPPPPKQIQRKPLHSRQARGAYQPTSTFDFNNNSNGAHGRANSLGTAGAIHPIYEADEDGNDNDDVGVALGEPSRLIIPESQRYSDPFKDGPSGSYSGNHRHGETIATLSSVEPESPAASREREIQEWVTDWAAADLLLHAQTRIHSHTGRISPTRRAQLVAGTTVSSISGEEESGRTESNLSERSITTSGLSGLSRSGSSSQGQERASRSNSLRGFITGINPFASAPTSTVGTSTVMSPLFDGPVPRINVPPGSSGSNSSKSFNTARTSFPALQAEGETLLPRPLDERSSGSASPDRYSPETVPGSPSKSKPSAIALGKRRGQPGWLGSLRRVFVGDDHTTVGGSIRKRDLGFGGNSRGTSPTRVETTPSGSGSPPRRTVSAGATLWRRKQGRGDWDDSEDIFTSDPRASTFTGGDLSVPGLRQADRAVGGDDEDEEWDIERAVQNRVVQVMFTVPKERLRVVNHDFSSEGDGVSIGSRSAASSLRSKKGSGKRTLQGVFAVPPIPQESVSDDANEREADEERDIGVVVPKQVAEIKSDPIVSTPVRAETRAALGEEQTPESRRSSPTRKKHTKVLEMVDKMEGRSSPERVSD